MGVLVQFSPSEFYGKLAAVLPCIPSSTFPPSDENLTGLMSFQKMLQIIQRGNFYKMVLKLGMGVSWSDQN